MYQPLADALRPQELSDVCGQQHILGGDGLLRRIIESGSVPNMIFYGPSGTGKTTVANLIAKKTQRKLCKLNATTASSADIKEIYAQLDTFLAPNGVLLYLDEIQYFNRKQQQSLLEYMEDGRVTLIASTTENPHFYIYNAIISRSSLFEFKPVTAAEMVPALSRALAALNREKNTNVEASSETLTYLASLVRGDVRRGIGLLENAYYATENGGERCEISRESVDSFDVKTGSFNEDTHYDLLSCLQKSIRGSDPDATAFYVAKLVEAGELISLCRRLQVIASEDIGLAYPQAAAVTRACCESAMELGFPEAAIPLINAALMLATAPKSNTAYAALAAAKADIEAGRGVEVPVHLRSPLFKGYRYPHDFTYDYVRQTYLPTDLAGRQYYHFGENKTEQAAKQYADLIRREGGKPKK